MSRIERCLVSNAISRSPHIELLVPLDPKVLLILVVLSFLQHFCVLAYEALIVSAFSGQRCPVVHAPETKMCRSWIVLTALFLAPVSHAAQASPPGRFSGSGALHEATDVPPSNRFELRDSRFEQGSAVFRGEKSGGLSATSPFRAEFNSGRFGLSARLSDATAGVLCGAPLPNNIFANGFEN
jgi:hypothetical protein